MKIIWSKPALADLKRVGEFLKAVAPEAASRTTRCLSEAPFKLIDFPRLGAPVAGYEDRQEVRRLIVGDYELRYEIIGETIEIVRIWHHRENR